VILATPPDPLCFFPICSPIGYFDIRGLAVTIAVLPPPLTGFLVGDVIFVTVYSGGRSLFSDPVAVGSLALGFRLRHTSAGTCAPVQRKILFEVSRTLSLCVSFSLSSSKNSIFRQLLPPASFPARKGDRANPYLDSRVALDFNPLFNPLFLLPFVVLSFPFLVRKFLSLAFLFFPPARLVETTSFILQKPCPFRTPV